MEPSECSYVYPSRTSLAEVAYICTDIPPDDILINIEVAFVSANHPDVLALVTELREYARELGGIQKIVAFSPDPNITVEEALKRMSSLQEIGADFAPQFA